MSDYYCDEAASGANDGTSPTDAWEDIETALEYNSYSAGDIIWVRRTTAFSGPTSDIAINGASDGTQENLIHCIGWPRNSHAISSADFTNGSTAVTVDDADMDREKHQGRFLTGPDGNVYLITRVISTTSIVIDREYIGSTVTNQAATISADEDYSSRPAAGTSAGWDSDADDVPSIDFGSNAYHLTPAGIWWRFANMEFKNGNASTGTIYCASTYGVIFEGCLFKQTEDQECLYSGGNVVLILKRSVFEGSEDAGAAATQYGMYAGTCLIKDCAFYNLGGESIRVLSGPVCLINVNVGVELANGDSDLRSDEGTVIKGYDVKLGGAVREYASLYRFAGSTGKGDVIENFGKVLGAHRRWSNNMVMTSVDVVIGSGDPEKRSGGADKIFSVQEANTAVADGSEHDHDLVFEQVYYASAAETTFRYYVQSDGRAFGTTELFLRARYISDYDDTSEYAYSEVESDETITARTGADDWSQYIEVTLTPAVASNVHLEIWTLFGSADELFIDPLLVVDP